MLAPDFKDVWQDSETELSPASSFSIEMIDPPEQLSKLITTFFHFHSDDQLISDVQPANTGLMMLFLQGKGEARFQSGDIHRSQSITLIAPTNAAMQYLVEGPFTCFGCAFTPVGWRALTQLDSSQYCDQFIDSGQIFGDAGAEFFKQISALSRNDDVTAAREHMTQFASMFLGHHFKIPKQQHLDVIAATARWLDEALDPDLNALYAELPVAERQAQRIIKSYFGCAPKYLLRKYRAVRAAMVLNDPASSEEERDAVTDLFYDQPHMIREIRHFAGRTPKVIKDDEESLLNSMWLDRENVRELRR